MATPLEILQARCPKIEEDFLLALRFSYYVRAKSLVPDAMYDAAEREFLARPEVEDSPLMNPGSDNPVDYPDTVKALSLYLGLTANGSPEAQEAAKRPASSPATPLKPKTPPKRAGYVEAPFVGDLFPEV